jgi:ATP-dependent helicase/nuclease subunit A
VKDAGADLAALLRADLMPALDRYEEAKKKEGALDFHDLIALLRRTLVDNVEVRRILSSRIDHVVVDEVQDTDPLQLDIIALLAAADPEIADPALAAPGPGKLFVVGDPKQSIYAFRRSSVDGYLRFRDRLVSQGAVLLELTTTFRCAPSIAKVVDRACAAMFVAGPFQPAYAGLSPVRPEPRSRPTVIALPVPRPFAYRGDIHEQRVREQLPELVAGLVHYMVRESGWRIPDPRTGAEVPLAPRHIVLIARSFSVYGVDQIAPITRALDRRGIPHAHVGGRSFHMAEEIVALRAAANAIEFPDDELSVYATLRGPFLALADADLFTYRETFENLHPFRVPSDRSHLPPAQDEVAGALTLLKELHEQRTRRSVEETLTDFLKRSAGWLSLAASGDGDLALARALRLLELAGQREARGALSFRRFVEDLEDAFQRGEDVAVAAPDGVDAVRLSTVHLSKGLEWPVVILLDPTTKPEGPAKVIDVQKGLYVDRLLGLEPVERAAYAAEAEERGRAEGARLLYVAATRARDILVIPTTGDRPIGQWLGPLESAIRPSVPRPSRPGPGCPAFGARTVMQRGDVPEFDEPPSSEVAPGLFELSDPSSGEGERGEPARVVFWDPELLTRGSAPAPSVRGQELFTEVKGVDGGEALRQFVQRRHRLDAVAHEGAMALAPLQQMGGDLRAESYASPDIVEVLALGVAPPPSKRLDRLVRAGMKALESRARLAARLARVAVELGATDEERASALSIFDALLTHPDLGPLVPGLRVTPITAILSDRTLVEGEVAVTEFSDELGAALVLHIHASPDPEVEVSRRLAVAAMAHEKATGRVVRAILVTLEAP